MVEDVIVIFSGDATLPLAKNPVECYGCMFINIEVFCHIFYMSTLALKVVLSKYGYVCIARDIRVSFEYLKLNKNILFHYHSFPRSIHYNKPSLLAT